MKKFIVISPHTAEECRMAVKEFREHNPGFLTHFEWGCKDNDHTAYAIFDADDHETARMSVPPLFRGKTKAVMLTNFDPMKTNDPYHR
jgi:hypothetical protein